MPRLDELLGAIPSNFRKEFDADESPVANLELPDIEDSDICPICHGASYVRRDVPVDHPDFGRALPCRCVEMESREVRLARLQRYSNLGPLTRLTFDNLIRRGRSADPRDQARFQRCVEDAEAFAKDPQGWLVIAGASGCGKTHIAAAVANRCLERGIPALFVVVPDLLDHLRAAYRPDAEVSYDQLFEQVRNAPVLVLDDLGTQSATPWAQEKLFQVINHRYNSRLPTVITTSEKLSRFDDRLRTRLGDPTLAQPHADPIAQVHVLEERRPLEDLGVNMLKLPMVQKMTFETFDLDDYRSQRDKDMRVNAFHQALKFADEPDRWLVLIGGREKDRTHLAAAIANRRAATGELPIFVQLADFLDALRRAINAENPSEFDRIKQTTRSAPFLILEDLEIGQRSDWVRDQLFQLLNPRCLAGLPTVITTPHQVRQLLADQGWGRLARLLVDPNFCSEIPVGETPAEETVAVQLTASRRRTNRKTG
jgi:DNA replication protein DnaC